MEPEIGEEDSVTSNASQDEFNLNVETSNSHTTINIPKDPRDPEDPDPLLASLMIRNSVSDPLLDSPIISNSATKNIDQSHSISRFPAPHFRRRNQDDIRPTVVSIGQFFHGDPSLAEMEKRKPDIMWRLLHKCKCDQNTLSLLCKEIRLSEMRARECYNETSNLSSDSFVQMLLLDCCFILWFLMSFSGVTDIGFFGSSHLEMDIRTDLLLLENQIPFFVLMEVHNFFTSIWVDLPDINTLLKPFITRDMSPRYYGELPFNKADHLLALYWRCCCRALSCCKDDKWAKPARAIGAPQNIPSATELHRVAGVVFKTRLPWLSNGERSTIHFSNGVMEMQPLCINRTKKILLTNLVGYEKFVPRYEQTVSSYILLMDSLINTENDVEFLQQHGVITNALSTNLTAATFFNELGDICTVDHKQHLHARLFRDVQKYYNSTWNRRFASLRHDYFYTTWRGIAVVAAGFLLVLTVIQTITSCVQTHYAIHPRN